MFRLSMNGLGRTVSFLIQVFRNVNGERVLVDSLPTSRPITLDIPAADYDAVHWRA